jgi:hypothetical protein
LGRAPGDFGVDLIAVEDLRGDQLAGQGGCVVAALLLGKVSLQDGVGRALPEIRLEDRRQRQPSTGSPAADAVSPRRHRPGR